MNTETQQRAHECAEKAAHYQQEFNKQKRYEIVTAVICTPLGLITLPFGAIFLIIGGAALAMALVCNTLAEQSHKEFFNIRDDILKEDHK